MSQKLINSYTQFCDGNGNPLAGGSLVFSETGTDTPKTVYSAENQSGSLGSSVDLDSAGRPTSGGSAVEIYSAATGAYRVTVKDSSGTSIVVTENVSALLEFSALTMTGQFLADDSTSTASPPISFDGDTNTGIARPAADTLAGVTGGTERWRTDSSGNTGFGTTSPGDKVEVAGQVKSDGAVYTRSNGGFVAAAASISVTAPSTGEGNAYLVSVSRHLNSTDRTVALGIVVFSNDGNSTAATFQSGTGITIGSSGATISATNSGAATATFYLRILKVV